MRKPYNYDVGRLNGGSNAVNGITNLVMCDLADGTVQGCGIVTQRGAVQPWLSIMQVCIATVQHKQLRN